jgi:putative ABC transport system permease protein
VKRALPHALARLLVRMAALGAPRTQRGRMLQEWDAELEREFRAGGGWSALAAAWGGFADARALRDLRNREGGKMTTSDRLLRWGNDFTTAARGLVKVPGFSSVAVFTLAIGLGGSAAIYTLLDRIVFDPLPYPQPERLVRLQNQVPGVGPDARWHLSTAQWVYFSENAESIDQIGLYRGGGGNIVTTAGPQRVRAASVTASTMSLLGAEARLGRLIDESDDEFGDPPLMLLSHGFWTRALGGDPDIVGATLAYNGEPIEVVGVLEPGLEIPGSPPSSQPDLWMPLRINRNTGFSNSHVFPSIARLAPGETAESVEAEMERITARLPGVFPNVYDQRFFDQYGFRTIATPLKQSVVGDLAQSLWVLFGGVGLVLFIACANVAHLFLVRVEEKRRELAIRTALGADRGAIARYLLSEAIVMSLAGGALALLVGYWAVPALASLAPEELPRIQGVGMDAETVLFTLVLTLAVAVAIAAFPVFGPASRVSLVGGERSSTGGAGAHRMRSALVVSQMALAITLIVGAGLLLQGLRALYRTDTGIEPDGVLVANMYMNPNRYPTDTDLWTLYREVLGRVDELPGVVSVGMGEVVPVSGGYGCTIQGFEDEIVAQRIREAGMTTCAGQVRVTPGYFDALGLPLLEGRVLDEADHAQPTRAAVVVSRAFAERFWPGERAIGKGVGPSGRTVAPLYRVVGVVDDVPKRAVDGQPPLSEDAIAIYYPAVHNPDTPGFWGWWWPGDMSLIVRTELDDPTSVLPAVRRAITELDPEIPIANARTMQDDIDAQMADVSFVSLLIGIAAAVALALAAVGLYGVIAYVVSKRTREIGTRLAIGAHPSAVVRGVVGRTLLLVGLGLVLGIPLALGASRVGRGLLVGIEPTAPMAYAIAVVLLTTVALAASWLPARRAAKVDPVEALRSE